MSTFSVIIPARYSSTRLPGKPLLDLAGKPMIQRVYEQAMKSQAKQVVVATDDERIERCVIGFGGQVCMTSSDHVSGTDRLDEVARQLCLSDDEIVVNVQGDEPLIPPSVIDQVAENITFSGASIATLSEVITDSSVVFDPNAVKVVSDEHGMALYFSRAPIPWNREGFTMTEGALPKAIQYQRHIGIYAYRVAFLSQFVRWGPCPLEQVESLEQLRAMWHGVKIHIRPAVISPPTGIDTPEDLAAVRALLEAE